MFNLGRLLKAFSLATELRAFGCFVLSLIVVALSGFVLYPHLTKGFQEYSELIASPASLYDMYKSGDIYFVFLITTIAILSFLAIAFLWEKFSPTQSQVAKDQEGNRGNLSSLSERLFFIVSDAVILYFSFTGFLCLYAFHPRLPLVFSLKQQLFIAGIILLLAIAAQANEFISKKVMPILQLGLPFLLLRFLRLQVENSGKLEVLSPNATIQSLLLLLLILIYLYQVWCVGWKGKSGFGAIHVGIISAYLAYKIPLGQALTMDGYHTGEMLLPFEQFFSHHMKMYNDFVSVHGWLAVSYGAIHHFFFDGTYASVSQAFSLTDSLYAGLIGIGLCFLVDLRVALLIGLYVLPSWNRFYLFPIVLLVLASPSLEKNKKLWLVLAFFLGLFSFLFDHAPGLAILIALFPFLVGKFLSLDSIKQKISAGFNCLLLLVVFSGALLGAISFVKENGPGNLTAFGVSMSIGHTPPAIVKFSPAFAAYLNLISELFKSFKFYGWILGILGILAVFFSRKKYEFRDLFLMGFPVLFSCALIPYCISGITSEGLGRVGGLTVIILGLVLPVIYFYGKREVKSFGLAILVLSFFSHLTPFLKEFISPINKATAGISLPEEALKAKRGPEYPAKLGEIYADSAQIESQKELHRFMQQNLHEKNDGYFDLTNQQNYYFIHDRAFSYGYPAHILAANEIAQSKVIQKLNANPPKFILFAPIHAYDWFNFNLRAYRFFKWIFQHDYTSIVKSDRGTFSFFIKNENPSPQKIANDMQALTTLIFQEDLNLLPEAWGRSWSQLKDRFSPSESMPLQFRLGKANWEFTKPISGLKNDFLLLRFAKKPGNLRITFKDSFGSYQSFRFQGGTNLLIPMGGDPRWISSKSITSLTIELEQPEEYAFEASLLSLER